MWIKAKGRGVHIYCQIQPRASRTEIVGLHGDPVRLRIRVAAPPVDGEANLELVLFFSKVLKIAKSKIELVSGQTGKFKEILILDGKLDGIRSALEL